MLNRRKCVVSTLIITPILISTLLLAHCGIMGSLLHHTPVEKISIGFQVSPAMALVMVARDEGFFQKQGLDVDLKQFTAGKFALQAFLGGSLDYAVSGEVPVCLALLQGNNLRVVSQVVGQTSNEVRVVARKDADNYSDPRSYFLSKRRKLATSIGGGPEFYTYNFLNHYGILQSAVDIVSQRPEDMPASLQSKSVDAISIFDPFAFIAEQQLGNAAMTFQGKELYSELYVLVASPMRIERNPNQVLAVIQALVQASDYISKNPDSAKRVVEEYTKLDRGITDGIWTNYVFKPALTKQLLQYWNEEASWAKATGKVDQLAVVPDFRTFVDDHFLRVADAAAARM